MSELNSKFKAPSTKQVRNTKHQARKVLSFEFVICDLFRISDFGFRIYTIQGGNL
jgi:hypothetical protein